MIAGDVKTAGSSAYKCTTARVTRRLHEANMSHLIKSEPHTRDLSRELGEQIVSVYRNVYVDTDGRYSPFLNSICYNVFENTYGRSSVFPYGICIQQKEK